ncbi:MAG: hypothetical protein H7Y42_07715 [Chitinophagaceae bacterium]|nr:hypothetical protein [Chitinophagaceae bacterium]
MKNLAIIIFFLAFGCKNKPEPLAVIRDSTLTVEPTWMATDSVIMVSRPDTCGMISLRVDSLKTALFLANYKLEKIRYYLNICLRNPSQDRFLKGWVRRALE